MTFHGFCAQLLKLAPQEAGVPLEVQPAGRRRGPAGSRRKPWKSCAGAWTARPARDPVRQARVRRLVRLNNDWPRLAGELPQLPAAYSLKEFLELAGASREAGRLPAPAGRALPGGPATAP